MKIWVYTLCYNEMKILPYIVKYWEKYADKVIVYDNGSNDGSREFLQQFDWIEIREHITDGFNDAANRDMKNTAWKEAREYNVNFVQMCDLDEVLYSPNNIKQLLEQHINDDVLQSNWIEVIADKFPTNINNELFHLSEGFYGSPQGRPTCTGWSKSKFVLFNPNTIANSNFEVGSHTAHFAKIDNSMIKYFLEDDIKILHFDKMGLDYLQYKYSKNFARLSELNKRMRWGIQYGFNDEQKQSEIDGLMKNKIDISNL